MGSNFVFFDPQLINGGFHILIFECDVAKLLPDENRTLVLRESLLGQAKNMSDVHVALKLFANRYFGQKMVTAIDGSLGRESSLFMDIMTKSGFKPHSMHNLTETDCREARRMLEHSLKIEFCGRTKCACREPHAKKTKCRLYNNIVGAISALMKGPSAK